MDRTAGNEPTDAGERGTSFPRSARLLRKQEFDRVFAEGRSLHCRSFTAVVMRSTAARSRLGLVVGRKLDRRATGRNRIRRRIREVFRIHASRLASAWDIVIIPRARALSCSHEALRRDMIEMLDKLSREGDKRDDRE